MVLPSITFVPLTDDMSLANPADRRRIGLPAQISERYRFHSRIAPLDEAIRDTGDILYLQSRDFVMLADHLDRLEHKKIAFSFSDAFLAGAESGCHQEVPMISTAPPPFSEATRACFSRFDLIVCGSTAQMHQICEWGLASHEKCMVLLDPLDTESYVYKPRRHVLKEDSVLQLVWEGFIDNIPALAEFAAPLARVAAKRAIELVILCSPRRRSIFRGTLDNATLASNLLPGVPLRFENWTYAAVSKEMSEAHVGLNPVLGDRFNWSKPANKSVILNWFGLPVVASANTANKEWIREGHNGWIPVCETGWERIFSALTSQSLNRMSRAARNKARHFHHSYDASWFALMERICA